MQAITTALKALSIGEAQQFRNLTAFPLLNPQAGQPDYITLSEAVGKGSARITELSEGGSVPQLLLDNSGEHKVLILDGEELIGAKQNRIANLTILADAHSKIVLPVSCVEHGRWNYRSADFAVSERAMFNRARKAKTLAVSSNLKATGTYGGNQSEVWDHIAEKQMRMGVSSSTSAMGDTFEQHHQQIEDYAEKFTPVEHQVGVMFAIDGEIEGMDLFDAATTFAQMLPKLTRSFAIDALESHGELHEVADASHASRFLDRVAVAKVDSYDGVGLGTDLRLAADLVAGGGLAEGDKLIHLAAFGLADPGATGNRESIAQSRLNSRRYQRMRRRTNNDGNNEW